MDAEEVVEELLSTKSSLTDLAKSSIKLADAAKVDAPKLYSHHERIFSVADDYVTDMEHTIREFEHFGCMAVVAPQKAQLDKATKYVTKATAAFKKARALFTNDGTAYVEPLYMAIVYWYLGIEPVYKLASTLLKRQKRHGKRARDDAFVLDE